MSFHRSLILLVSLCVFITNTFAFTIPVYAVGPTAVIGMSPDTNLMPDTDIQWDYSQSIPSSGATIVSAEWQLDDGSVTTSPPPPNIGVGTHTVKLRVYDSSSTWSNWVSKEFLVTLWDLAALFQDPNTFPANYDGNHPDYENYVITGYESGFYDCGLSYNDHATRAFYYYKDPNGTPPTGGWPAVVLVHGGGGTAFYEWVQKWVDANYAAIAMDLEGHLPELNLDPNGVRPSHEYSGPVRDGVFADNELPTNERWFYHAVADVIKACSLISNKSNVNPDKIGICGYSWGGVITNAIAGIDDRFKFAVPIYGCGYLYENGGHTGNDQNIIGDFEPSLFLSGNTIPTMYITGTNDAHFSLNSWQKTADHINGALKQRLEINLAHGGRVAWTQPESYAFADSVIKGSPIMSVGDVSINGSQASVTFTGTPTAVDFCYTCDSGAYDTREWNSFGVTPSGNAAQATLSDPNDPNDLITAFFFRFTDESAYDPNGMRVTSNVVTDPTTVLYLNGIAKENHDPYIFTEDVTVSLVPSFGINGIEATYYSYDGINFIRYTSPFIISQQGTITIYYYSKDNFGNSEAVKSITIITNAIPTPMPSGFRDDFEDGDPNGWVTTGGTWTVVTDSGYKYQCDNNDPGKFAYEGNDFKDVSIQAVLKLISSYNGSGRGIGVTARYTDGSNHYIFYHHNGAWKIFKRFEGTGTVLDSYTYTLDPNTNYTVKFEVDGYTLKGYVNGQLLCEATDFSLPSGKAGLFNYYAKARYDDIDVKPMFYDDFADGNAIGWVTTGGTWSVVTDGSYRYQCDNNDMGKYAYIDCNLTDVTIQTVVKQVDPNYSSTRSLGVTARYSNSSNLYAFYHHSGAWKIKKILGGTGEVLVVDPNSFNFNFNTDYIVKFVVYDLPEGGAKLEGYVGDVLQCSVTDSTSPLTSGKAGLYISYAKARYDNVDIR